MKLKIKGVIYEDILEFKYGARSIAIKYVDEDGNLAGKTIMIREDDCENIEELVEII